MGKSRNEDFNRERNIEKKRFESKRRTVKQVLQNAISFEGWQNIKKSKWLQ